MKDDLEPLGDEINALVNEGRAELEPDEGAKERIDLRLRLALEGDRAVPSRVARTRVIFSGLAIAASLAIGAGLMSIVRPALSQKKNPPSIAGFQNPVPPSLHSGVQSLGAFGDATGRALLDDASASLMQGDAPGAIMKLDEHARTHPAGPLTELRETLYIEALAREGRSTEARARAAHFSATYPQSLLGPAVSDALGRIHDE